MPKAKAKTGEKRKEKFKLAYTNRKTTKLLSESGSNELSKEDLSYLTEEERLLLSSWDLPTPVLARYKAKGITSLFKWQLDCLANENVLKGKNLVYSAPTSAGKTLVAEILMIKRVLELGRKAIMILPFVAVAREKMYSLQELYGDVGVRVEGFMGSYNPPGGFKAVDIAICTIEKANSLINRLLEEGGLSQLGTIVVDELHLLGDPHRGYLLELLLTKIRFMSTCKLSGSSSLSRMEGDTSTRIPNNVNIQVIGMSATLPNLELLALWLKAELVQTTFRPVPLVERIKIGNKIFDPLLTPVREVNRDTLPISVSNDPDDVVYLTLETISDGHSLIIFCPSKKMCEQTAEQIAREFYNIGNPSSTLAPQVGEMLRSQLNGDRISEIVAQLSQCPGGMDEILGKCIAFGVAFHHAGLTYDERDIVESGFKRGVLRVIVATSTLSAGVNLPARRVIIKTPTFSGGMLDVLTYKQMSGRAGRQGIDTEGESILICSGANKTLGEKLIQSSLPEVTSALVGLEDRGFLTSCMKRAIIEVISSGVATTPAEVQQYSECTLLSTTIKKKEASKTKDKELSCSQLQMDSILEECLQFLVDNDFIRLNKFEDTTRPDEYMPTQLGCACLASSLSPDESIVVFKELDKARHCFVLENELHVIYQVTPIYLADQWRNIDWNQFLSVWQELSPHEKKVAELVGVEESFILRAMVGIVSRRNPKQASQLAIHQRFFTALALNDLVNEMPISSVAEKYGVNKGVVQNLQQSASTFAGMVTVFAARLGWANLELLLSQFQERLQFGVQRELCDLVRLSLLNGQRARILYDAGIKTVAELAAADPAEIEQHLHKAGPFSSAAHGQKSKSVWMLGKKDGLSERDAAQQIVEEARTFLQIELGLPESVQFYRGSPEKEKSFSEDMPDLNKSRLNLSHRSVQRLRDSERSVRSFNVSMRENGDASIESRPENVLRTTSLIGHPEANNLSALLNDNVFDDSFTMLNVNSWAFKTSFHSFDVHRDEFPENQPQPHTRSEETDSPLEEANANHEGIKPPDANVLEKNVEVEVERSFGLEWTSMDAMIIDDDFLKTPEKKSARISDEKRNDADALMNSIVNLMETSFHMSWDGENEVSSANPKLEHSMRSEAEVELAEPAPRVNLNQQFSEDMFAADADAEAEEAKVLARNRTFSSSSNEILNDSSENNEVPMKTASPSSPQPQPIHSTPRQSFCRNQQTSSPIMEEDGDGKFDEASKQGPRGSRGFGVRQASEFKLNNGSTIKLMVVDDPSFLPEELFKGSTTLAISFKLNRTKRSSSTPRAIGNKFIGRRFSLSAQRTTNTKDTNQNQKMEDDTLSICLYNGLGQAVWCFQWCYYDGDKFPSRGRLNLATNAQAQAKLAGLFERIRSLNIPVVLFDGKEKLKSLFKYCGKCITFEKLPSKIYDPRIANWLIQTDEEKYLSLDEMVDIFLTGDDQSLSKSGWRKEATDSYFAWKIMSELRANLEELQLWNHFTGVEMPSICSVALMEMNGLGLDHLELERLKRRLEFQAAALELKSYQIAGRQFNLNSSKDIRQILFREIGLTKPENMRGTGKDVLKKLDHELPRFIIEWRKVTCALQIVVSFLHCRNFETGRVHGYYSYFTLTGRIMMSEPSLQCIPRDFHVSRLSPAEVDRLRRDCEIRFGSKFATLLNRLKNGSDSNGDVRTGGNEIKISVRKAFVPASTNFVLLSADYCQLELRILAHLCKDEKLAQVLNSGSGDVFRAIAVQLKNTSEDLVSDEMRQEAKGVTYGIIYGMGAKTLSEQLEIEEINAARYISQFMRTYPRIKAFIDDSVAFCRKNGYVETLSGRRRYLEHINSENLSERAQAERQAVNSRIQGSASDLVKLATNRIHSRLATVFPESVKPVQWKARTSASIAPKLNAPCFPVLNLHDELMFEVNNYFLPQVAKEIQLQMESCINLNIKIPVVVRTGPTWGTLTSYNVM